MQACLCCLYYALGGLGGIHYISAFVFVSTYLYLCIVIECRIYTVFPELHGPGGCGRIPGLVVSTDCLMITSTVA